MSVKAPHPPAGSPFGAEKPTFPVTRPDYTRDLDEMNRRTARVKARKNLFYGLSFLAPNILGFLTFTAIPLVFSMVLAFSNWDLKLHNPLREKELAEMGRAAESIKWVGFANFTRLLSEPDFYRYLGNTLFFMIGLPFAIAASLVSAIMLSKDLRGGGGRVWASLIAGAVLVACSILLVSVGMGSSAMLLLVGGLTCGILIAGTLGGNTVYRTLFYVPHFTSGVATYLLWKKLYSTTGPITAAMSPPVTALGNAVNNNSPTIWYAAMWFCALLFVLVFAWSLRKIRKSWEDGDIGWGGAIMSYLLLIVPIICSLAWFNVIRANITQYIDRTTTDLIHNGFSQHAIDLTINGIRLGRQLAIAIAVAALLIILWQIIQSRRADQQFIAKPMVGVGGGLFLGAAMMSLMMVLLGFCGIFANVPAWAAHEGLEVPSWLNDMNWAKPAIMIMGFWGAIGSNTMLLYLAALTNVPQDLYEAADIDGATRFQKFWNVTWPQLAPTTFFIVVMGVIGGLQGGFEMARVMTYGGPAGQTTTLAYFIYTEGFETGRLGFSSAVAWTLFLMVLLVTLFNWKFGNKYVNE